MVDGFKEGGSARFAVVAKVPSGQQPTGKCLGKQRLEDRHESLCLKRVEVVLDALHIFHGAVLALTQKGSDPVDAVRAHRQIDDQQAVSGVQIVVGSREHAFGRIEQRVQLVGRYDSAPPPLLLPRWHRVETRVTSVGKQAGLLIADVAVAVGQQPVAGDRYLAYDLLRFAHGLRRWKAGEGVERGGATGPVGRPGTAEVETVLQIGLAGVALERTEIGLSNSDFNGLAAFADYLLGSGFQGHKGLSTPVATAMALLDEIVDHIHEAIGEAKAEVAGAAHDETRDTGHGGTDSVVVVGVHDGLVPDCRQAVALEVGVVALQRIARCRTRTGYGPVIARHQGRCRAEESQRLGQQRLHIP